jgi:hypothetical protein
MIQHCRSRKNRQHTIAFFSRDEINKTIIINDFLRLVAASVDNDTADHQRSVSPWADSNKDGKTTVKLIREIRTQTPKKM